jgi:hypothetical protein
MSLYYQYGVGGPSAMQTPDYQTFLRLLEQMRQQSSGGGQQGQSQGGGMGGLDSLFKMFGGGNGAPSMASMNGAAGPMVDSPVSGPGMGGIVGLFG